MADKNALPRKILVVDGDETVVKSLRMPLSRHDIKVEVAMDLSSALYHFSHNIFPVVILDVDFEELSGLFLIQRWRALPQIENKSTGFILLIGNRRVLEVHEKKLIEELKDIEIVVKPINIATMLPAISRSFQNRNQKIAYHQTLLQALSLSRDSARKEEAKLFVQTNLKKLGLKGYDLLRDLYEDGSDYSNALAANEMLLTQGQKKDLSALNHKGRILLKMGRVDEALAVMEDADKEAPHNIQRINEMASAYLLAKKPDKAVIKMREMIQMHPDQQDLKFDMFHQLYEHGFDDHAINLCKDTSNPKEVVQHYNNKGVAHAKSNKIEEAILEYERALRYFPKFKENYRILFNLALAHMEFKNLEHYVIARDYLKRCLDIDSSFEKAIRLREQIDELIAKWKEKVS